MSLFVSFSFLILVKNSPSLTYTVSMLQKFARTLALLPSVRVSEDSWSLMIRRILIVVNNLLNDAFIGLEEGIL